MDLLGSILDKMEKPPVIKKSEKEQQLIKKQEENLKKIQEVEKEKLRKFRDDIKMKLTKFQHGDEKSLKFEPMEKLFRSIVHELAEDIEFQGISFGTEGVDRHVVVYKKEYFPCEEEIACIRRGQVYDPELKKKKEQAELQELQEKKNETIIESKYQDKYKHLIGDEAGVSAAKIATPNSQFGYVPSSNKRDQRSIEQTLADIRKKKLKVDEEKSEEE